MSIMVCNCEALRAEMISQRELFVRWFNVLSDQNAQLINKVNALSGDLAEPNTTQPLISELSQQPQDTIALNFLNQINDETDRQHKLNTAAGFVIPKVENHTDPPLSIEGSPAVTSSPEIESKDKNDEDKLSGNVDYGSWSLAEAIRVADNVISVEKEDPAVSSKAEEASTTRKLLKEAKCSKFKAKLSSKSGFIRHLKKGHKKVSGDKSLKPKDTRRVHKCDKCPYQTPILSHLKSHSMVHSEEKPFSCDLCNYQSRFNHDVSKHKRIVHSGEKPFKCDLCDFCASQKSNLNQHMKRHQCSK